MRKGLRKDPAHIPCATCRLQFNAAFNFRIAAGIADYLHDLGITDCYASPIVAARPGSLHGYDVIDFTRLNPELGSPAEFSDFIDHLHRHDMGLVFDVVPNHMCIADPGNAWWWDVLENGPSSPFARFFDVDWNPPKQALANKILLPVLADQYGKVLEEQQIQVIFEGGGFRIGFDGARLPIAPNTWNLILDPVLGQLRQHAGEANAEVLELESILTAISHLPPRTETDSTRIQERQREMEVIRRRLNTVSAQPAVRAAIDAALAALNGRCGDPRSFDALEQLLGAQAYRLSFWRVAAEEINYRRFFDVNDLAAIRVEDPAVFAAVHGLVFDLIRQGLVSGLRVDHPDGLFEPEKYFADLQDGCAAASNSSGRPYFIVAEKIVVGDESVRPGWRIAGTTGYDFLNCLNGLFVDRSRRHAFAHLYRKFSGWSQQDENSIFENSKNLIMQVSMSGELNVLSRMLERISEQHRWSRDFTRESLRLALRDIVACFPIYRTYIGNDSASPDPEDERYIRQAIAKAKRRNPAISESVFDFVQNVLLLADPEGLSEAQRRERRLFILRLQQYTGPVMAKGLEDTACYRYFPLASVNEVGADLHRFGVTRDFFHARNAARRKNWPHSLLATSTHDTKRSEDVRARINVLSEIPMEWYRAINLWRRINQGRKADISGVEAPSTNAEYLLYQTLIGTWPLTPMDARRHVEYVDRIQTYMEKALREAKLHTSWVSPNAAYENVVRNFVDSILSPAPENEFLADFRSFQRQIAEAGMLNSLSQVLLKVASPGVPDFYQGTEIWDFSLVDPDNRRPVDYEARRSLLAKLAADGGNSGELAGRLLANPEDGAIKMYVTTGALKFRRSHAELFAQGSYLPIRVTGLRQRHVVAFARVFGRRAVLALACRFFMSLGHKFPLAEGRWGDTRIPLRKGIFSRFFIDVFTGRRIEAEVDGGRPALQAARVFSHLPIALLYAE